ncbi:MAG: S8 family serine peptidase, partial [bacterium]
MRKLMLLLLALSLMSSAGATSFTPELVEKLATSTDNELIQIMIVMEDQADFDWMVATTAGMNKLERRQFVVNHLNQIAEASQTDVLAYLDSFEASGKVQDALSVSIANIIGGLATREVIQGLMNYPEIAVVDHDPDRYMLGGTEFSSKPPELDDVDEIAWGVADVHAPEVWAQGFDGSGVIVSVIDTGVNYNHLDIADHMWNGGPSYPYHGWDFYNNDNNPIDQGPLGHGT